MILNEGLDLLIEELLEESAKTDFIVKFGEETLRNFDKAKDRLKNNGMSVDYGQYLKMDKEELDNLILSLYDKKKDAQKRRMLTGMDKEIRGKYNYLGEKNGYKVYQPLDAKASMDLGVNTGWCTTGRYGHAGHPEYTPSYADAKGHFDDYTKNYNIKLYYFLDPETMYGKYAISLYPQTFNDFDDFGGFDRTDVDEDELAGKLYYMNEKLRKKGYRVSETNIEVFDANDETDFSAIKDLPIDLIPEKIVCDITPVKEFEIKKGKLIEFNNLENKRNVVIPDSVTIIGVKAFANCTGMEQVIIPVSIVSVGESAFSNCTDLKEVKFLGNDVKLGTKAFENCTSLTTVELPKGLKKLPAFAFEKCSNLSNIVLPDTIESMKVDSFSDLPIKNIYIPASLTYIEPSAFNFEKAETIVVDPKNPVYDSRDNCNAIIKTAADKLLFTCSTSTIPSTVKILGNNAFCGTENRTITVPDNITTIEGYAFYGCSNVDVIIPDSVTTLVPAEPNGLQMFKSLDKYFNPGKKTVTVKTNNPIVLEYCERAGIDVERI